MKRAGDIARDAASTLRTVKHHATYDLGAPPARLQIKPLEELSVDHLGGSQEKKFRELRQAASEWIKKRQSDPGLSFVITGSVGTGKTTVIQNLRQSAQVEYTVIDDDGQPMGDPFRSINSRFVTASDFMAIMDPGKRMSAWDNASLVGRQPLYILFGGVEVVAVDDAGTEELAFVAKDLIDTARHNRYREAFDYFYTHNISILVTSMVPLLRGGQANPEFINIFGPAAFDRLYERARGFMFDLTGFPSYRAIQGG